MKILKKHLVKRLKELESDLNIAASLKNDSRIPAYFKSTVRMNTIKEDYEQILKNINKLPNMKFIEYLNSKYSNKAFTIRQIIKDLKLTDDGFSHQRAYINIEMRLYYLRRKEAIIKELIPNCKKRYTYRVAKPSKQKQPIVFSNLKRSKFYEENVKSIETITDL